MRITNFHAGGSEILEVNSTGTTFYHNRTHHTATVEDMSVKIKSDNFVGRFSLNRKQAARLIRLLQKQLIVKKKIITESTRRKWAKIKH